MHSSGQLPCSLLVIQQLNSSSHLCVHLNRFYTRALLVSIENSARTVSEVELRIDLLSTVNLQVVRVKGHQVVAVGEARHVLLLSTCS